MQRFQNEINRLNLAALIIRLLSGKHLKIFLLLFFLSGPYRLYAQNAGNLRMRWIYVSADTLTLDTLTIIPGTLKLFPQPDDFYLDYKKGNFYLQDTSVQDSLLAVYRVFPYNLHQSISHKDTMLINPVENFDRYDNLFTYSREASQDELIALSGLQKSGNISRGILVGNTRNLSVNSNLNLQLSGKIADDLEILASITDNNIPVQPDGNTQQLQDFDKIFIQVFNDKFKLIAGDYEMQSGESYFMRYFKKNLGLSFQANAGMSNGGIITPSVAVAMSKGKFARNLIKGEESLQGPYRLTGNNNETFIIVLSGTERVYIDGVLLSRGADRDYVIDYNSAEITFMPRILITKDKRITVEFQYSEKNYFRSLVQAGVNYKHKKIDAFFNFYSEQDAKNQEQQQSLSESDKAVLAAIGNNLDKAVVPSIEKTQYDPARVMYALIDSLGYDSVFVVSSDPATALYQLRFSIVGQGKGDYVQGDFTANGRTFVWVAPDTLDGVIVKQGNYAPVRKLIAPQTQQMLTAGAKFHPDDKFEIKSEVAWSRFDPNTFSDIDNDKNQSWAGTLAAKKTFEISRHFNFDVFGGYEYVNQRFKPIERFRTVEFTRDWNLQTIDDSLTQQWWESGLTFYENGKYRANYTFRNLNINDGYKGNKHVMNVNISPEKLRINYSGSYLTTGKEDFATAFYRHLANAEIQLKPFTIGVTDEFESNRQKQDSLLFSSYRFDDWKIFIRSPEKSINIWKVYAGKRIDMKPQADIFRVSGDALNTGAEFHYMKSKIHRFNLTFNYRKVERNDSLAPGGPVPEDNLLGRVEYILRAAKGAISWNIFYQFGSGLDQKREYFYQEVSQGLGVYEWIDLNEDGIKDLNEFFIASNPALANYIRVFTPNNNFVKVLNAKLSQNLSLNPGIIWQKKGGFLAFLGRFSTQTFYSIDKSTQAENPVEAYNPFFNPSLDSALVSYRNTFRNTVFFNRSYTKFSIEYTYLNNRLKNLLLNGFQTDGTLSHNANIRWNITRKYTLILAGEFGNIFSASDFIIEGNYKIYFNKLLPEFRYQPNQYFRISLIGEVTRKRNDDSEIDQNAAIWGFGLDSRFNMPAKGSLFANIKFSKIDYTGPENTPSQVKMLEALRPGLNLTWSINWQQNLNKFLQLSINYNGRKSETVQAIHVGGVEIRAFF